MSQITALVPPIGCLIEGHQVGWSIDLEMKQDKVVAYLMDYPGIMVQAPDFDEAFRKLCVLVPLVARDLSERLDKGISLGGPTVRPTPFTASTQ